MKNSKESLEDFLKYELEFYRILIEQEHNQFNAGKYRGAFFVYKGLIDGINNGCIKVK